MLIGDSPGWFKVVSLIVMDRDGSKHLRAAKSLRCFAGRFTELSDSELPNSTVTGMTYRSLMNIISAFIGVGEVIDEVDVFCIGLII